MFDVDGTTKEFSTDEDMMDCSIAGYEQDEECLQITSYTDDVPRHFPHELPPEQLPIREDSRCFT